MIRPTSLLVLLASTVPAAQAHDWYGGLRDSGGRSCCNDRDCHPVGLCAMPDRREGLLIEGRCRPIPWDKVLAIPAPDGQAHACWFHVGGHPAVQCVILPGQV